MSTHRLTIASDLLFHIFASCVLSGLIAGLHDVAPHTIIIEACVSQVNLALAFGTKKLKIASHSLFGLSAVLYDVAPQRRGKR